MDRTTAIVLIAVAGLAGYMYAKKGSNGSSEDYEKGKADEKKDICEALEYAQENGVDIATTLDAIKNG